LYRQGRRNRHRGIPWFTEVWEMGNLTISEISENSKELKGRETSVGWS